jgi:hypothetical protein
MKTLSLLLFLLTTSITGFAQDAVKVDPAHYRVLFENTQMRVLEYRDKPGDKAPMHSHPAYMTYVTATGKTKIVQPNGETSVENTAGSENVGNTPTQELLVEFKDANNPCSGTETGAFSSPQADSTSTAVPPLAYSSADQPISYISTHVPRTKKNSQRPATADAACWWRITENHAAVGV